MEPSEGLTAWPMRGHVVCVRKSWRTRSFPAFAKGSSVIGCCDNEMTSVRGEVPSSWMGAELSFTSVVHGSNDHDTLAIITIWRFLIKIVVFNSANCDRYFPKCMAWERVTLFGGVRETHSPNSVSCKQQEQGRCKNCSCNFRDRRPPITTYK
ncbi:hypothetical protein TNCV_4013591 [Trichonephila clavipes]|nr:hypothetical protein TNCV_4013591 [Trichonephila clavipes]